MHYDDKRDEGMQENRLASMPEWLPSGSDYRNWRENIPASNTDT